MQVWACLIYTLQQDKSFVTAVRTGVNETMGKRFVCHCETLRAHQSIVSKCDTQPAASQPHAMQRSSNNSLWLWFSHMNMKSLLLHRPRVIERPLFLAFAWPVNSQSVALRWLYVASTTVYLMRPVCFHCGLCVG